MTEEISDVLLLFVFGAVGLLVLLVWLAAAAYLALLIGRVVRRRDREVPVDTREQAFFRPPPTDTVLMERVRQ